jgi:acetoin utilization deacetylase AcuC-like enzyme
MFGLLLDKLYEEHDTGTHPERSERLKAVALGVEDLRGLELVRLAPVRGDVETLALAHDKGYIEWVGQQIEAGATRLDADTKVCARSYDVALQAVGGSLGGIEEIMAGRLKRAFFAIRPPGHHAERDQAMGFCLFNNVAVAARHLVVNHKLDRVAVFDFDVHHGNGTMHIFYDDPSVFYSSVHQWPWYPGTGRKEETGVGRGLGTTLNFPYPSGAGNEEYETATRRFAEAMDKYKPQFLLVSAGYDAHWSDPLAGHQVTEEGYVAMSQILAGIAHTHCSDRLAVFLEGGYNLAALRNCSAATIKTLSETL